LDSKIWKQNFGDRDTGRGAPFESSGRPRIRGDYFAAMKNERKLRNLNNVIRPTRAGHFLKIREVFSKSLSGADQSFLCFDARQKFDVQLSQKVKLGLILG